MGTTLGATDEGGESPPDVASPAAASSDVLQTPAASSLADDSRRPSPGDAEALASNRASPAPAAVASAPFQAAGNSAINQLRNYLDFLRTFVDSTAILFPIESPGHVALIVRTCLCSFSTAAEAAPTFLEQAQAMRVNAERRIDWAQRVLQLPCTPSYLPVYARDVTPRDIDDMSMLLDAVRAMHSGVILALASPEPSELIPAPTAVPAPAAASTEAVTEDTRDSEISRRRPSRSIAAAAFAGGVELHRRPYVETSQYDEVQEATANAVPMAVVPTIVFRGGVLPSQEQVIAAMEETLDRMDQLQSERK